MGLAKTGYDDAIRGTMSEKINLNANGQIAQDGETIAGTKRLSFSNANAANNLTTNNNIVAAFLDFAKGSSDTLSNKFAVTWEV